jgi:hypothetical protein
VPEHHSRGLFLQVKEVHLLSERAVVQYFEHGISVSFGFWPAKAGLDRNGEKPAFSGGFRVPM